MSFSHVFALSGQLMVVFTEIVQGASERTRIIQDWAGEAATP
jgi:hypothetical protein